MDKALNAKLVELADGNLETSTLGCGGICCNSRKLVSVEGGDCSKRSNSFWKDFIIFVVNAQNRHIIFTASREVAPDQNGVASGWLLGRAAARIAGYLISKAQGLQLLQRLAPRTNER